MRQTSWLDETPAAKRPCRVCGDEATHIATWDRPGKDPDGGAGHRVGWQEHKDLCEVHASRSVLSSDPPRKVDPIYATPRQKKAPESLTLPWS